MVPQFEQRLALTYPQGKRTNPRIPAHWTVQVKAAYNAWRQRYWEANTLKGRAYKKTYTQRYRHRQSGYSRKYYAKARTTTTLRWKRLNYDAKRRHIKVSIDYDYACRKYSKPCYYCNDAGDDHGIDRIDSSRGYERDNVVSCCSACNKMKSAHGIWTFLMKCSDIRDAHASPRTTSDPECIATLPVTHSYPSLRKLKQAYIDRARHYSREFNLTTDEFQSLVDSPCFYCNKAKGGIDRVDSAFGYTQTNSVSCCALCNRMKWDTPRDDFIARCCKIADKHDMYSGYISTEILINP